MLLDLRPAYNSLEVIRVNLNLINKERPVSEHVSLRYSSIFDGDRLFETYQELDRFNSSVINANNQVIESISLIRGFIDEQFVRSVVIAKIQLTVYITMFYVPYFIMNCQDNEKVSWICWILCLITQILFLAYEFVQMKAFGVDYLKDPLNFWELSHHGLYFYFAS